MARLRDVPVVLRTVGPWTFFKRIVAEVLDDNLFTLAGGLAYAWLFAIFPFLVFLMNIFPLFARGHEDETKEGMRVFLKAALPDPAAKMLWDHMEHRIGAIIKNPDPWVAGVSLVFALWAASKGIGVTMAAMEKCYELEKGRAFYTRRPMAFGLTIMVSGLVLLLVLLLPAGAAVKAWLGDPATIAQTERAYGATQPSTLPTTHIASNMSSQNIWALRVFDGVRIILALAVVMLILAVFYHFGPGVRHRWQYITPGSVFVLLTWVLVGFAFRFYVNRYGQNKYQETYGAVGGTAILLLLFYLDALVLLIGAQINSEIDFDVLKVPRGTRNFLAAERRAANPSKPTNSGPPTDDTVAESAGAD